MDDPNGKPERVEIGFAGGQVVAIRIAAAKLKDLTSALNRGKGWFEIETEDGTMALAADQVVFLRIVDSDQRIGFGSQ